MNLPLVGLFLAFLMFLQGPAFAPLADESSDMTGEEFVEEAPGSVIYSFVQEIPHARAFRSVGTRTKKKVEEINLTGNQLGLGKVPGAGEIFVASDVPVKGAAREVIALQAEPGSEMQLVFSHVPPGRKLKIFIALSDLEFREKEQPNAIGFEVWVGRKKVLDTEVTRKGWKEEEMDLTLPLLLQRAYTITFKVHSSDKRPRTFVFYGYIE